MPPKKKKAITLTWELTCRRCKSDFEVPVPSGPTEEKKLRCPECGSHAFERRETILIAAPSCGG
jgi:rRNA maturation endonuclease Nob1